MGSKASSDTTSTKNEIPETIGRGLLENCAKNGDDANAKLAQKTLENANKVGIHEAFEQMAQNCFKHPENGRQLSYSEMRMYYG